MENILSKIIEEKKKTLEQRKKEVSFSLLQQNCLKIKTEKRSFKKNISTPFKLNLIAEIKKASPSVGIINSQLDIVKTAKIYEEKGAAAISVLTEEKFFLGKETDLLTVKEATKLPILRKDFIFDPYQVYQTKFLQADAFLLISSILSKEQLQELISIGKNLEMDILLEVHNLDDLEKALSCDCEIIGINNRDLTNFKVDIETTFNLKKYVPEDKIVVSESGIKTKADILKLKEAGINAVLIGETFLRSKDIGNKIEDILSD